MKSTKIAKFIKRKYSKFNIIIHFNKYGGGGGVWGGGGGGVIRAIKLIIFRLAIAHLYNILF